MDFEDWITYTVACFILTMTPGPSILIAMIHSLNFGIKKSVFTAIGDISANFIQMLLVAIGLGVIIASSDIAFQIVKWVGVAVLLYMGLKILFTKKNKENILQLKKKSSSAKKLYTQGFLVAASNPKAIVFFSAFFPQFIDPEKSVFIQLAIMCPTMAILDFTWVMIYAIAAKKTSKFIIKNPLYINRFSGSVLIGASGFLALFN